MSADVDRQSDILSQVPHLNVEETTTPWLADRKLQNTAILQEVVSIHQDNSTGKRKNGSGNDYSPPSSDILLLWKPLYCMLSVVRVVIYTDLVGVVELLRKSCGTDLKEKGWKNTPNHLLFVLASES